MSAVNPMHLSGLSGKPREAQKIYKSRSMLVHTGRDSDLPQSGPMLEDAVRQLLKIYLVNPGAFEDDALDQICIAS